MLDIERVLSLLCFFSEMSSEKIEEYRDLCRRSMAYIENRIRPEVSLSDEENREILCAAAAARAYRAYAMLRGAGAGQSDEVRVGDISLKASSTTSAGDAGSVEALYMEQAAHLLLPDAGVFWQVDSL